MSIDSEVVWFAMMFGYNARKGKQIFINLCEKKLPSEPNIAQTFETELERLLYFLKLKVNVLSLRTKYNISFYNRNRRTTIFSNQD